MFPTTFIQFSVKYVNIYHIDIEKYNSDTLKTEFKKKPYKE